MDMAMLVSSILRGKVVWVKERVTLTGCSTRFSMNTLGERASSWVLNTSIVSSRRSGL